jgi:hypothetical protein
MPKEHEVDGEQGMSLRTGAVGQITDSLIGATRYLG